MRRPKFENDPGVEVEVKQTIVVSFLRGRGTDDSPIRRVYRYYHQNGETLFEWDPTEGRR